ncbi:unnamed protein product [Effrenium voratum]|nr:unnamed protein product [Effrenium voratum]
MKCNDGSKAILKHFTFPDKVKACPKKAQSVIRFEDKEDEEIDAGFDFILQNGPRSSSENQQLRNDEYLTDAGKKAYGNFKAGNKELSAGFEEGVQKEEMETKELNTARVKRERERTEKDKESMFKRARAWSRELRGGDLCIDLDASSEHEDVAGHGQIPMEEGQMPVQKRPSMKSAPVPVLETPGDEKDGVKVNALSFKQMQDSGVYMEKSRFAFSMKYLGLSLLRFLRGNLAPGQEASVRSLLSEDDDRAITSTNFQLYLQRALEGFALAQRNKDKVVPFAVDRPAEYIAFTTDPFLFATPVPVKVLSFDGHFGTSALAHALTNKSRQRLPLKNRTGGWQFVIDPDSRRVLAAKEHVVNECLKDKVEVVRAALSLKKVNEDAWVHDDACHFETYIARRKPLKAAFKATRCYVIDELQRANRKCKKTKLTPAEKKRVAKVRTNMSEVFNLWIRRKNFCLNSMNAYSHRFWVQESTNFWNNHLREMPQMMVRRTNTTTRKRPAAAQKRPAAAHKRPSSAIQK